MYILELCCGWKSVTDVFVSEHGWDSTTVDILPKFKPTILADMTKWDYRSYYRAHPPPDVIWASPPCRTFTVQAWGMHRDGGGGAISSDGESGDACVRACLECIGYCLRLNPNLIYFVENPLYGAFRKLPCVQPYLSRNLYRTHCSTETTPPRHTRSNRRKRLSWGAAFGVAAVASSAEQRSWEHP